MVAPGPDAAAHGPGSLPGMTEHADIVVVGGGIIGCGIAAELASRGTSVVLVERSQIGAGASGRNHGLMFRPEDPLLEPLARVSSSMYAALAGESTLDLSLDRAARGLVIVACEDSDWPAAEREAQAAARAGSAVQRLDEAALREAEPALSAGRPGGFLIDDGFRVDPAALTLAYAEQARAAGAQIWTNTEVKQILLHAGAVQGVATDAGVVEAPTVVNAAGPWAAKLARTARAEVPAVPIGGVRGWLLLTESRPGLMRHLIVSAGWHQAPGEAGAGGVTVGRIAAEGTTGTTGTDGTTGRQFGSLVQQNRDGHVLLGGSREPALSEEPLGADSGAGVVGEIARRAAALVPALCELSVTGAWSGVRPTSPDGLPIIGWVPAVAGLFVAGGHGGAGVVLGGGSARLAAQLLVGEAPFTDPAPFDPARFVPDPRLSRD
jgi:glycine/D-amino acid oxidase-like deaminating enzyme